MSRKNIHAPPADGSLPPLLSVSVAYTHVRTGQSDWRSESPLWDWDREKYWRPGFKNIFRAQATVSLLRVGVPLQIFLNGRTQTLLAGRNVRPSSTVSGGLRLFAKF